MSEQQMREEFEKWCAIKSDCDYREGAWDAWQAATASMQKELAELQALMKVKDSEALVIEIDILVNNFLSWKLPEHFYPDAGISFTPTKPYEGDEYGNPWWPIGTNLFTAPQAREMFMHCLTGAVINATAFMGKGFNPSTGGNEMNTKQTCKWAQDMDGVWETECGHLFEITEGTPNDNYMKYCCYCGKLIEQSEFEWEAEEME